MKPKIRGLLISTAIVGLTASYAAFAVATDVPSISNTGQVTVTKSSGSDTSGDTSSFPETLAPGQMGMTYTMPTKDGTKVTYEQDEQGLNKCTFMFEMASPGVTNIRVANVGRAECATLGGPSTTQLEVKIGS